MLAKRLSFSAGCGNRLVLLIGSLLPGRDLLSVLRPTRGECFMVAKDGVEKHSRPEWGCLMKTFNRFLLASILGLTILSGANAHDPAKPPPFLKIGDRYCLIFADGRERDRIYAEVLEFGHGAWMRVKYIVPDESGRTIIPARGTLPPDTKISESWFNLAMLAAVIPAESSGVDEVPATIPSLMKVGTSYFFRGQPTLPYFGKVLELGEEGWFRVREINPKWSIDQPRDKREREWWINIAFVTQVTEAKPKELP